MLEVTRPGGIVLLNHYVDEGAHQRYLGMHQWNITERDGNLVVWSKDRSVDITDRLRGRADVNCRLSDAGNDRRRLHALIVTAG